ncbi:hypothetical protein HDV62DRAFT_149267 [Trichoderma sp. SZMC 28011]
MKRCASRRFLVCSVRCPSFAALVQSVFQPYRLEPVNVKSCCWISGFGGVLVETRSEADTRPKAAHPTQEEEGIK